MALTRRDLLGLGTAGSLTLFSGCTGLPDPAAEPTPGFTGAPSSQPAPESTLDPREVPSPRYSSIDPDDSGSPISGNDLDAHLDALGSYRARDPLRTIRITPGDYARTTPIVIPSGVRLLAAGVRFVSQIPGAETPLLELRGVTDVAIEGGTWDGNKSHNKVPSEWKHVVTVIDADRITLDALITTNATGDGVYIGSHSAPCRDVTIKSVKSTKNGRNGMSVTSVVKLRCADSIFTANGDRSPRAGVDIEPNSADAPIEDVKFLRCAFTRNGSRGFLVVMQVSSPQIEYGIQLVDCIIDKNANPWGGTSLCAGLVLIRPRGVLVTGGTILRNHTGILIQGRRGSDAKGGSREGTVRLVDLDVHHNNREGLLMISGIRKLEAEQVRLFDNSREEAGYFSGIMLAQGSNMTFSDCVSTGSRMYGLQASDPVKRVTMRGCDLRGNGKGQFNTGKADVTIIK